MNETAGKLPNLPAVIHLSRAVFGAVANYMLRTKALTDSLPASASGEERRSTKSAQKKPQRPTRIHRLPQERTRPAMQPAEDHQRDRHQDAEPAHDGHHDSQERPEHTECKEEERSQDFPDEMNSVWNSPRGTATGSVTTSPPRTSGTVLSLCTATTTPAPKHLADCEPQ
jgi:hypothetical protein